MTIYWVYPPPSYAVHQRTVWLVIWFYVLLNNTLRSPIGVDAHMGSLLFPPKIIRYRQIAMLLFFKHVHSGQRRISLGISPSVQTTNLWITKHKTISCFIICISHYWTKFLLPERIQCKYSENKWHNPFHIDKKSLPTAESIFNLAKITPLEHTKTGSLKTNVSMWSSFPRTCIKMIKTTLLQLSLHMYLCTLEGRNMKMWLTHPCYKTCTWPNWMYFVLLNWLRFSVSTVVLANVVVFYPLFLLRHKFNTAASVVL